MQHGTTRTVDYPSSSDASVRLTGLLHLPHNAPPPGGWPFVTYGHMTTGAGDRSAPSIGTPEHPEWRRMSQGDELCDALLARGIVVLRPDYPGLGSAGVHPYLIGEPLARSIVDMAAARSTLDGRIGDRWVAAGHSEGALATLFTAVRDDWPTPLLAAAVFAPVTRMDLTIGLSSRLRRVPPGSGVVSAMIGLMLLGAGSDDASVARLLETDALGPRAQELWGELATESLTELARPDSWGAVPPAAIASRELYRALFAVMRENEVADLVPKVPVRIDSALLDEVAPAFLTTRLVRRYRGAGVDVTHRRWRTHHSGVMRARYAPSEAADWISARLG